MNRRKFLSYVGCGCCNIILTSCGTVPITKRRQLKIIPEAHLNAKAALIYEKVKEKEKLSDDKKTLNKIKEIGNRIEYAISEYFNISNLPNLAAQCAGVSLFESFTLISPPSFFINFNMSKFPSFAAKCIG